MSLTENEIQERAQRVQLEVTTLATYKFNESPMEVGAMMLWCENKMFELCKEHGLTIASSIRTKGSVEVKVDGGRVIGLKFLTE